MTTENKKIRPDPVKIEQSFNQLVIDSGGQLVSSLDSNLILSDNADYYFDSPTVIAELKCFQKDLFNDEEDIQRIFSYFEKWKSKKLIEEGDELKIIFGTKKIPKECWPDLITSASKTIERAIHKGNKQIKETKLFLKKPNAKGLLLLCNDGNYFIQNNNFITLICNLMTRKFLNSEIDGFVYFTYNQTSIIPDSELDWQLWAPFYRDSEDSILAEFVNMLGFKFNDYFSKITGIPMTDHIKFDSYNQAKDLINKMKYIPKDKINKKKGRH
jgi:hypothetical protein